MERLISEIKTNFRTEISQNDPSVKRLRALQGELFTLTNQQQIFELSEKEKKDWNAKVARLTAETQKLEAEIDEIRSNRIYQNAFERRFELPAVLDDNGDFVGFDVVIGNPPYGAEFGELEKIFIKQCYKSYQYKFESYIYFIEKGLELLKLKGNLDFITPILWLTLENNYSLRSIIIKQNDLNRIFIHGEGVF